jgi:hypothetical protein
MSKPITISIVGNAGPLKKSLKESDDALDKFGQGIKKFGVAAAVGIGALGAGIGVAIGKASDLEETVSKVGVIFGESWSRCQEVRQRCGSQPRTVKSAGARRRCNFRHLREVGGISG